MIHILKSSETLTLILSRVPDLSFSPFAYSLKPFYFISRSTFIIVAFSFISLPFQII